MRLWPDHVQVFWKHKCFGNQVSDWLTGQPIRGLVSKLTYVSKTTSTSKTLAHDPALIVVLSGFKNNSIESATYFAWFFLPHSISQYGDSGNGIRHKITTMLGIIHNNAVFLHDRKYPIVHTNHVPSLKNMLGNTVRLFLIFG